MDWMHREACTLLDIAVESHAHDSWACYRLPSRERRHLKRRAAPMKGHKRLPSKERVMEYRCRSSSRGAAVY